MSNWFKFTYRPYPGKDLQTGKLIEVFRPTVPIVVSYKGVLSWEVQALVDSGSDRNLFPAKLGELVNIDIRKGNVRPIEGIGNSSIRAYTHRIKIYIASYNFETEADFAYEQQSLLLGREGFFNFFKKIEFKEKEKSVEFRPLGFIKSA